MGRPGRRAGGWLGPPGPGPGGGGAGWQPLCKHPPALQDICWLPALGTTLSVHLHVEILGVHFTLNKERDSSLSGSRV